MPSNPVVIFPPRWNHGEQWRVVMKTQTRALIDLRPRYVEDTFDFRVAAVPDAKVFRFAIEVRNKASEGEVFTQYYRSDDFSLEKVTRHLRVKRKRRLSKTATIRSSTTNAVCRLSRIFRSTTTHGRQPPGVHRGAYRIVQEVRDSHDRAQIMLQRSEPLGFLRVDMEWAAGDPWWSKVECSENPPPDAPFNGEVVASGHLLK